jgi:hypothetical protein
MSSVARTIQDGIHGVLEEALESLAVDDRTVTLVKLLPRQRHTNKGMPRVVVERPFIADVGPWSSESGAVVYTVPVGLYDGGGATADKIDEARERLELLWQKVRAALMADRHWGLAKYEFFSSFARFLVDEITPADGANMLLLPVSITVPVIPDAAE